MEEIKETINLGNRYRARNKLISYDGHKFYLVFENEDEGSYCRFGLKNGTKWEDHEYEFVDPSGGPFMKVGGIVNDYIIERITVEDKKTVLYLKKY